MVLVVWYHTTPCSHPWSSSPDRLQENNQILSQPVLLYRDSTLTQPTTGYAVVHSTAVEDAFRKVDRRFFVPRVSCKRHRLVWYGGIIISFNQLPA